MKKYGGKRWSALYSRTVSLDLRTIRSSSSHNMTPICTNLNTNDYLRKVNLAFKTSLSRTGDDTTVIKLLFEYCYYGK